MPHELIHLALFTSPAKLIHRCKNREKILEKNTVKKQRKKRKKTKRGNKKKKVEQDRRENKRTQKTQKGQEINGKRDRTLSGQIVTIVFVSSLQHRVSLSSPAHNFNYTLPVQSTHAQMRQERRSRWILLSANPRLKR